MCLSTRVLALVLGICTAGSAAAALPIRAPEVEATVVKVVPATEAEKKNGVVATLFLKDQKNGIQVMRETAIHKQMGKLVPLVEASEIKAGQKLSVWTKAKSDRAEGVLIFP
jgi:hypothetical protein